MLIKEFSSTKEVFGYLGVNSQGVPYHLHLLNLYWGEDGEEATMNKYRNLAIALKNSPDIISQLICDLNWRPTLVGNAIVILLRANIFQKDLLWRLENESWVAPQIAVGLALLNDGLAEKELLRIIESASEESNPKAIMSAYSSLKFLKSKVANDFQQTELFEILKVKDSWDHSIKIAEQHWEYWKNIKPVN